MTYDTRLGELESDLNETEIGPEIIHEYILINKGPSQISQADILVAWQRKIKINNENEDFLFLTSAPHTEGPVKCVYDSKPNANLQHNKRQITSHEGIYPFFYPIKNIFSNQAHSRNPECSLKKFNKQHQHHQMDASKSSTFDMYCSTMRCKVGTLKKDQSGLIRLRFRLWSKHLAKVI